MSTARFRAWVDAQPTIKAAADVLGESYQLVQYWVAHGIPSRRLHAVSEKTGIPISDLVAPADAADTAVAN